METQIIHGYIRGKTDDTRTPLMLLLRLVL